MILASRSPKGKPFAVPLWFVAYRGRIYATTSASSLTVCATWCPRRRWQFFSAASDQDRNAERFVVGGHAQALRGMPPPAVLGADSVALLLQPTGAPRRRLIICGYGSGECSTTAKLNPHIS